MPTPQPPPDPDIGRRSGGSRWDLQSSSILRLITLCALYAAQGLPYGFIAITVIAYLTREGMTPDAISGLLIMVGLPWSFKWMWGPLIDLIGIPAMGRRRPWILLSQSIVIALLLVMGLVPGLLDDPSTLGWCLFLLNCFVALQDVSVDALAVDLLRPEERGRVNGLMYGCNYGGLAIGSAALGMVVVRNGIEAAFLVLAVCIGLIMLLPLFLRERQGDRLLGVVRTRDQDSLSNADRNIADPDRLTLGRIATTLLNILRAFLTLPTAAGVLLALLASISTGLFAVYFPKLMLEELGWELESYTGTTGSIAFVGLGGAILGGFLADAVGPRRLAAVSGLCSAGLWIIFALTRPYWDNGISMVTIMILEAGLGGMFSVSLFALFMGVSWKLVAATQFTAYMALLNASRLIGNKLGGWMEDDVTYNQIYLISALSITAAVMVLPLVNPEQAQAAFRRFQRTSDRDGGRD